MARSDPRHPRHFFTNWRESDASLGRKLGLTFLNRARSVRNVMTGKRSCCGHPGEPGC